MDVKTISYICWRNTLVPRLVSPLFLFNPLWETRPNDLLLSYIVGSRYNDTSDFHKFDVKSLFRRRRRLAMFIRVTRHTVAMIFRHERDVAVQDLTTHLLALVNVACMSEVREHSSLFVQDEGVIGDDVLVRATFRLVVRVEYIFVFGALLVSVIAVSCISYTSCYHAKNAKCDGLVLHHLLFLTKRV